MDTHCQFEKNVYRCNKELMRRDASFPKSELEYDAEYEDEYDDENDDEYPMFLGIVVIASFIIIGVLVLLVLLDRFVVRKFLVYK